MVRVYELARPLAFLTAKGPTIRWYRDVLPLLFATCAVATYFALPVSIRLVGQDSIATVMAPLFAGLPGFFIAALAAVATFQGGDLDRDLSTTTIWIEANGDARDTQVTLRVFLGHLFAYLTLLSIVAFLTSAGATLLAPNLAYFQEFAASSAAVWDDCLWLGARGTFVFVVALLTGSLLSCASLGLYFLAERIHQELHGISPDDD